mmetsp:Transcript_3693/g.8078  ORF Transcript_3693/g.8078 Transcript_3693/m.8078 type:complete len:223 (+) Transcript_3693:51-719(+)
MGNATYTQMHGSVLGDLELTGAKHGQTNTGVSPFSRKSNFPTTTAHRSMNAGTKAALHLQCTDDAAPTSGVIAIARRRRRCSLPSCSTINNTLPTENHHRASPHPSAAGRPPRHPNSKAPMPKSNYDESKSLVYSRNIDFLINEKFPSQLKDRVDRAERDKSSIVDDSNKMMILTNGAFRSLLGSGEPDESLISREARKHEREFSSHWNFQCLDVWEKCDVL